MFAQVRTVFQGNTLREPVDIFLAESTQTSFWGGRTSLQGYVHRKEVKEQKGAEPGVLSTSLKKLKINRLATEEIMNIAQRLCLR